MRKLGNLAEQFRGGWAGWCLISMAVGLAGCGGSGANGGSGGGGTPTVATPGFSLAGGTYTATQSVTITSATPGATIYYTTNGTTPTTASSVYSAPVSVTASETLEAIAVESGYDSSAVASVAYVINLPPVANVGGPYSITPGVAITFNGSGSSSPQGKTLTYAWNFGDGNTATGVSPTHIFATAGTYTVQLTVTDSSNVSSTASVQLIAPNGRAYANQKALSGAHVYVLAANTTGYGGPGLAASSSNASISLLSPASTGQSDSVGAYVTTGSDGSFLIAGDYTCTAGSQVYLYALGGSIGSGTNTAIGLLAALGTCPSGGTFTSIPYVVMNEVSTIATAYAIAGFATDATHVSSSGTALAKVGIANALAAAANLETLSTGVALATTPAGNGNVPQAEINTLANVLADCTGSGAASSNACSLLMGYARSGGTTGAMPTDTATAAINIAHNPGANVGALYGLVGGTPPFTYQLTVQPNDWTIALTFTGSGLSGTGLDTVRIDGSGNAWVTSYYGSNVTKLSSMGAILSGSSGFTGGGLNYPTGLAIDLAGNAWVANFDGASVTEISASGAVLSGSAGYTGGGLSRPYGVAVDGTGNVWVANEAGTVTELSNTGAAISGSSGFAVTPRSVPWGIAIDSSGNAWISNNVFAPITELSGAGVLLSGASGFTGGGLTSSEDVAIDGFGNAWFANGLGTSVVEFSPSGAVLSGVNGYRGGGIFTPRGLAIDGASNVWITNAENNTVTELSNSGAVLSGTTGYTVASLAGPGSAGVDGSGNVWIANVSSINGTSVAEFIGAGVPVVTPLAAGVKNNMIGMRP